MKMNKRMIHLANKIFKFFTKYLNEYEKVNGYPHGFIWIKHMNGEVAVFSESMKTLKKRIGIHKGGGNP